MKPTFLALLFAFFFACAPSTARATPHTPYVRAEIYLVPWDIVTAVGINPDRVRLAADSHTTATDARDIEELVALLDVPHLQPAAHPAPVPVRRASVSERARVVRHARDSCLPDVTTRPRSRA
jgi:hypothetical protein